MLAVIRALLGALLLTQTVGGANRPKYGGTLRVELYAGSFSLDPREWKAGSIRAAEDERLATLIYDRLVTLDDYGGSNQLSPPSGLTTQLERFGSSSFAPA